MNRFFILVVFVFVLFFSAGCNKSGEPEQKKKDTGDTPKDAGTSSPPKKPKDPIVGRWVGQSAVEFTAFGTVKTVSDKKWREGKWLVSDNGDLDMEFSSGGRTDTQKCHISATDSELSITELEAGNLEGKSESFVKPGQYKRVKTFSAAFIPIVDLILGKWRFTKDAPQRNVTWEFKKGEEFIFCDDWDNWPGDQKNIGTYRFTFLRGEPVLDIRVKKARFDQIMRITLSLTPLNDKEMKMTEVYIDDPPGMHFLSNSLRWAGVWRRE